MFHNMSKPLLELMANLEAIDARDRLDGTPTPQRMRQVPPETGKFLALLAANAPQGTMLEIGTSAGYSSLWLALACREKGNRLKTFEVLEAKVQLARENLHLTGMQDFVQVVQGDARQYLSQYPQVAFCFLDAEKYLYQECYDLVVPNLVQGGILCADNVISHKVELADFLEHSIADERVDALVVPIGKGVLVCRKA
jgi:caffeoyl-CoA O-methyltransferase